MRLSELIDPAASDGDDGGYYLCEDENGVMRCSCGRELIQLDDDTYKCPGGYPIYRFDEGDVIKDKFGNLYLKKKH